MSARLACLLAGVWAGVLLCLGAMAAPTAFATLIAADAGRVAGRLFAQEAYLSLALAVLLLLLARRRGGVARPATGSVFSAEMLLVLGTVFCTVAGYFAAQPMMAAARSGQAAVSFATLHAVSAGFFVLKGVLVLALAWRLSAAFGLRTAATS